VRLAGRYPVYMQFFSTPEKLEIEELPFVTAERNATRREALTYYRKVAEYFDLDCRLYTDVVEIEGAAGDFRIRTRDAAGGRGSSGRNVVVATGGFHEPEPPGVPGEELPKVAHHYVEPHPYWRRDVLVVGGSNSAVEATLELFRSRGPGDPRPLPPRLRPGGEAVGPPRHPEPGGEGGGGGALGSPGGGDHPGRVVLRDEASGALETLPNDHVLALTGWRRTRPFWGARGAGGRGDRGAGP
jgi:thioredoxin reductase (NADPH)